MNPERRSSAAVIRELLRTMTDTVTSYHPEVGRTISTFEGLIQGTACFPGGAGLWRGRANGGPLPEYFPGAPIMFVGHNFDSVRGYVGSLCRRGEVEGDFWTRLLRILDAAELPPTECFFTNALMGLKPGSAEGDMPSVSGYREQCARFLARQVEIVGPKTVVALGTQAANHVSRLDRKYLKLLHPGDWCLRPLATRDTLLVEEGRKLRDFLGLPESGAATPEAHRCAEPARTRARARDHAAGTTDEWGFRAGTRNAFLMRALEEGGKTKEEIRLEFLAQFPQSAGKSTFNVFFTDLIRPFGSASVSRCVRIESDERGRLGLDPERAALVKHVVAAGILEEINALESAFPKKNQTAIDEIVERYSAPRK